MASNPLNIIPVILKCTLGNISILYKVTYVIFALDPLILNTYINCSVPII